MAPMAVDPRRGKSGREGNQRGYDGPEKGLQKEERSEILLKSVGLPMDDLRKRKISDRRKGEGKLCVGRKVAPGAKDYFSLGWGKKRRFRSIERIKPRAFQPKERKKECRTKGGGSRQCARTEAGGNTAGGCYPGHHCATGSVRGQSATG